MPVQKRILFAPLDWGLGHATRCMPLIDRALTLGHVPVIAADGRAAVLLREQYPELEHLVFPGVDIRYGKHAAFDTLLQVPALLRSIRQEQQITAQWVRDHQIDLVVSDNRYGVWSRSVPSVFLCHQLAPIPPRQLRFTRPILSRIIRYWLRPYQFILVPDLENKFKSLAGHLSHAWHDPRIRYISPLSRLPLDSQPAGNHRLLVVLSGPEPQRTVFERRLRQQLRYFDLPSLLVQGKPGEWKEEVDGHVQVVNQLAPPALAAAIRQAELVVARSGYSTVMDLWQLGGRALFVPTPGQTEQAYLAQRLAEKEISGFQTQEQLNIARGWEERAHFDGFRPGKVRPGLMEWDQILSS